MKTKKMIVTAMMACLSFVLSTFVSFPRMAPFQHMMNILTGVLLGPFWGFTAAFITGLMRMILGGRSIQALIGAIVGAFLGAYLYKITHKLYMAVIGEIIGTGVLSALLVYPFMVWFYGLPSATPFWTFIPAYIPSAIMGACLGAAIVLTLMKSGVWKNLQSKLNN